MWQIDVALRGAGVKWMEVPGGWRFEGEGAFEAAEAFYETYVLTKQGQGWTRATDLHLYPELALDSGRLTTILFRNRDNMRVICRPVLAGEDDDAGRAAAR